MPRFRLLGPRPSDINRVRRDLRDTLQRAGQRATHEAGQAAHQDIRSQMRSQRLGGLANTVKFRSDLRDRHVHSRGSGWSVSSFIYAAPKGERAAGALKSYLDGGEIVPGRGKWLAIASNRIPRRAGRRKMTPQLYVERGLETTIGPLEFVKGPTPGIAYLIVKGASVNPSRPASARRLPRSGKPRAGRVAKTIVAFTLIRATRRTRRVDVHSLADKWAARVPGLIERELDKEFRGPRHGL
jgi:hypothetical protein